MFVADKLLGKTQEQTSLVFLGILPRDLELLINFGLQVLLPLLQHLKSLPHPHDADKRKRKQKKKRKKMKEEKKKKEEEKKFRQRQISHKSGQSTKEFTSSMTIIQLLNVH